MCVCIYIHIIIILLIIIIAKGKRVRERERDPERERERESRDHSQAHRAGNGAQIKLHYISKFIQRDPIDLQRIISLHLEQCMYVLSAPRTRN